MKERGNRLNLHVCAMNQVINDSKCQISNYKRRSSMLFTYCPHCGNRLINVRSYFYEKKQMLMLGYRANMRKDDFTISKEVDSATWIPLSESLSKLREGSIAWQLVREVVENENNRLQQTSLRRYHGTGKS